ncbi:MAG: hypothetical protein WC356_04255 [Candidatus Micrarchaeia archaeon]|jgi:hypothetical protein
MLMTLEEITEQIRDQLDPAEKKQSSRIGRAIKLALDEITQRYKAIGLLKSYTITVAAGTRELTIAGESDDIDEIWAMKFGTGDSQEPLDYVPPARFIDEYDNPSASAGVPDYYTILASDDGRPMVKFNCPTLSADSLLVYYQSILTPNRVERVKSASVLVYMSLAHFWGAITEKGAAANAKALELISPSSAANQNLHKAASEFGMSKHDRDAQDWAVSQRNNRC